MYLKLALKNMKQSTKDYLIYMDNFGFVGSNVLWIFFYCESLLQ